MNYENHNKALVSVIMPVYNAASFVNEAVLSAVSLPEVGELILVEDGSKDNSWEICVELASQFQKVKLYTHENKKNKGASESRNLGIKMASLPFVAFLDADDVYCPNRFEKDISLLLSNSDADGCYSAVRYINETDGKVFTLRKDVPPKKLFHYLLRGTYGHFHTNGITLKKSVFDDVGFFSPNLKLHQDTEMWLRISFAKKIFGAEIRNSVALIRRHEGNRIWVGQSHQTKYKAYKAFYDWVINKKIQIPERFLLVRKLSILQSKMDNKNLYFLFCKNFFRL